MSHISTEACTRRGETMVMSTYMGCSMDFTRSRTKTIYFFAADSSKRTGTSYLKPAEYFMH